jgi:hypothetical protein
MIYKENFLMKKFSFLRVASIFVIGATSLFLVSCGHKDSAVIKAVIQGASEKKVVLNMLNMNKLVTIDTLTTNKKGFVKYRVKLPDASPNFYYITYHGTTVASLLLDPGDKASITVDTLGKLLKISGSEESKLLNQVNDSIVRAQKVFDSLTVQLLTCDKIGDKDGAVRLRYELGHLYVKQKQYSIKSILKHPYSFTNITQLYRQFNENLPLFAQLTDGVYFKQVCDSLKPKYPNSPYIKVLEGEVTRFNNYMELNSRIQNAGETAFPDLALPDLMAKTQHLNSLLGRPFMLLFWSASDNSQKMLNAELLQLYKKYKGKGFQIYEVCIDADKTNWASVVKTLPWINVCDGMGASSPALSTYNITNVPSMFLFDKSGTIAGRDIFNMKNLDIAISKL